MRLGPLEIVLILVVVLVLFGGGKLAGVGKALGQSIRDFKKEIKRLVSTWSGPSLKDSSARVWSGLVRDYYVVIGVYHRYACGGAGNEALELFPYPALRDGGKCHGLFFSGVLNGKGAGPQGYLLARQGVFIVPLIPPQGHIAAGELHPYLVMPPGMQLYAHKSKAVL